MSHYYFCPEQKSYFPSVTTILQAVLPEPEGITIWKKNNKNWEQLLAKAASVGTLVHFTILNPLSDYTLDPSDLLPIHKWFPDTSHSLELSSMMFDELIKEKEMILMSPRRIEKKIINYKEKYAGKYDLCCPVICPCENLKGEKVLFDLKTSSRVRETHLIQLGGYYASFPEEDKPDRVAIIKITPNAWTNPKLKAELHVYSREQAETWGEQFIELARKFHSNNMVPKDGIRDLKNDE